MFYLQELFLTPLHSIVKIFISVYTRSVFTTTIDLISYSLDIWTIGLAYKTYKWVIFGSSCYAKAHNDIMEILTSATLLGGLMYWVCGVDTEQWNMLSKFELRGHKIYKYVYICMFLFCQRAVIIKLFVIKMSTGYWYTNNLVDIQHRERQGGTVFVELYLISYLESPRVFDIPRHFRYQYIHFALATSSRHNTYVYMNMETQLVTVSFTRKWVSGSLFTNTHTHTYIYINKYIYIYNTICNSWHHHTYLQIT